MAISYLQPSRQVDDEPVKLLFQVDQTEHKKPGTHDEEADVGSGEPYFSMTTSRESAPPRLKKNVRMKTLNPMAQI